MSTDKVALTSSMRSNLLSLKNTQSMFDKTQDRLASGYKVNSAMDNPSSYFTAQSLNSRADDLSGLLDSIGQAISTLETADQGITSLQDFVEQAKSIANSARDTSNVASSITSSISFLNSDNELDETEKLSDIITGVKTGDNFNIRLGDSTKITGTTNMTADQTLKDVGLVAGKSMEVIIDGVSHTFTTAAGSAKAVTTGDTTTIGEDATVQDLMDGMTEALGRKTVSVTLEEGKLSIATLDNTSVAVRSEADTESHATQKITGTTTDVTALAITPDGGSVINVTITTGSTKQQIVDAVNANAAAVAANISAELSEDGITITIVDNTIGTTASPTVTATATTAPTIEDGDAKTVEILGSSANDILGFDKGTDITVTEGMTLKDFRTALSAIEGVNADFNEKGYLTIKGEQGDDLVITAGKDPDDATKASNFAELLGVEGAATNGNNERATYATQFDKVLTQINELVQDTSYKGINLLNGDDLTVVFNENRTSSLELKGVTFNAQGLGLTSSENEWIDNDSIDKALNQVDKATSLLRAQASEFGQNLSTVQIREDFTTNMINNLQTGADKLTLADMNEESANLLALQTRQQLATNSLSMANQAAQSVLNLF